MQGDDKVLDRFKRAQESLVLQSSDLPLQTISAMVLAEAIDIKPAYQRRERWSVEKQSALIESFLLNIPIPPVYLSEEDYGRYSVIDGKQRITAIHKFLTGKLSLKGVVELPELNGRTFDQIPAALKQTLTVRPYLRVVTLLKQSDPELKYEVFTRLNSGGERLEAQEVRNVAFRGPLNDLIYELADMPFLRQQLKITSQKSAAYADMTDAEYVLRFFALANGWRDFSGSLSRSMDEFMIRNMNNGEDFREHLRDRFVEALDTCRRIWGKNAYRRPTGPDVWRDQTLAGMYDAQMVAVSMLDDGERMHAIRNAAAIAERTQREFLADAQFEKSVRVATNTPSSVIYRIQKVHGILLGGGEV
ncbi:DUF262 domain-containing protein [Actinacidiphila glaucinigra]|uniref:DUF262 domain-containing protein n=1 Tax=Actinacidiphila glaucinigra TaxID=235986 RepID=UPI002DDB680F|nr:DUF262 domain-containing protein [Actinacidiphila glaucinigra]WSD60107.1 DUF262 domain-containing protein [Actinacidiphila glaucinigra]